VGEPRRLHWSTGETRTYHGSSRPDLLQAKSLCGRWLWAEDLFAIWWQHTTCEHCVRMIEKMDEEPPRPEMR